MQTIIIPHHRRKIDGSIYRSEGDRRAAELVLAFIQEQEKV